MKFTFDIDGLNHYREVELSLGESKTLSFEYGGATHEVTATFATICNPIKGSDVKTAVLRLDYKGGRHREELFDIQ